MIKVDCPYCNSSIYVNDAKSFYQLYRLGKALYKCDFCKNTLMAYQDGNDITTTKIHKDKRNDILKGGDNMINENAIIDKNTIFETVYSTIKDNMDWGFSGDDKFTHFVDGVIAMAEGLIDKIEPKTEETEK